MNANIARRMRQRAAAMVEAVVVIPFFLIIFASIIFVGNLYNAKLKTIRLAKQKAWTYAMNNCEGVATNNEGNAMGDVEKTNPNANSSKAHQLDDQHDPGMSKLSQDMGSVSVTEKASATADTEIGGYTKKLSTTTKVMCNETPYDGDIEGLFKYGWSIWKKW